MYPIVPEPDTSWTPRSIRARPKSLKLNDLAGKQHEVFRLDITVQHRLLVGVSQCADHLHDVVDGGRTRESASQSIFKRLLTEGEDHHEMAVDDSGVLQRHALPDGPAAP